MKRTAAILLVLLMLFGAVSCAVQDATVPEETPDVRTQTKEETTTDTETKPTVTSEDGEHVHRPSPGKNYCLTCGEILKKNEKAYKGMIYFSSDDKTLTEAYKIALKDVTGNVKDYKAGALKESAPCLMAGAAYGTPWTRDAAINVSNAYALLDREVSKNTLLSVLKRGGTGYVIDGQYWDCIIWAIGAYAYVTVSGDNEFAVLAEKALSYTLKKLEREEFDETDGLFRGPAVYGDGIAAYPDQYTITGYSGIEGWPGQPENKDRRVKPGFGIPMKALSTNCVYYRAYQIYAAILERNGKDPGKPLLKAAALREAINKAFWNEEKGTYDYLAYECDYQEALGISFALLFDVADERQKALVVKNAQITDNGIACVWPCYERYLALGGYGRHSGTVWPHAQGFWARAAFASGDVAEFENELYLLAGKAVRDRQFYEIYHPDTGEPYGGLQGGGTDEIHLWTSCEHQTWSATAYLSLIYYDLLGVRYTDGEATFKPYLPTGVNEAVISGMKIGNTTFDIVIERGGQGQKEITVDTDKEETVLLRLAANG